MHPALVSTYRTLPAVLVLGFLTGCGDAEPEASAVAPTAVQTQEAPSASEPAANPSPEPTGAVRALTATEVPLDASVFWGPHRYDLGTAVLEPADGGGYLRVDVQVQNLGEETFDPNGGGVWLAINDLAAGYSADNLTSTPPQAKVGGDLEFLVDEDFEMANAVLHFGELTQNSSTVPLNGDDVVTQESVSIDPPTGGANEMWEIEPTGVTLHPHDLWASNDVEQGRAILVVDLVATLTETDTRSLNVSNSDFTLTLPDGTSAPAPGGGYPGINEVVAGGQSTPEVAIAFEVPWDAPGDYVLTHHSGDQNPIHMPFGIESP